VAEKTVVIPEDERLIEAVSKVVTRLEGSHGPLWAALLIRLADRPADEWTLLVGSHKLVKRRVDGINATVSAMKGLFPKDLASRIRGVDVLRQDDPVYVHLRRAFKVASGGATVTLDSCNIFGIDIARAIVLRLGTPESCPADAGRASSRRTRRKTA
jgi:hypothetical protein